MNHIIVTGATSFIGLHLVKVLLTDPNNHVFAIVRPNSLHRNKLKEDEHDHEHLTILELSLEDLEKLPALICDPVEVFYYLAWEGTRAPARDDPFLQARNYQLALKTLKIAAELGCRRFVGVGSQAEYGKCLGRITEAYPAAPVTEYGKAKLRTCEAGSKLATSLGVNFVWARIFSVYGQGDFAGTLVMSGLSKMLNHENLPLTQCTQSWDYLHVSDVANALVLLSSAPAGIYNVASGVSRPLNEYVFEMIRLTHSKSLLEFGAIPYNSVGAVSFQPVVDQLKAAVGWTPRVSFEEGIVEIIKILQEKKEL